MCYYNAIKIKTNDIIPLVGKEVIIQGDLFRGVQSGFEYPQWPVMIATEEGTREIRMMEWGFIPTYIQDRDDVKKMREGYKKEDGSFKPPIIILNAIGEEILSPNKIFKQAALHRRCLVLSSGFYEWRHIFPLGKNGKPLKRAQKFPYFIQLKDQPIFFMAGIWQNWIDKGSGETMDTFAIVTTKANSLLEQIHNTKKRMPVILPETLAAEWLQEDLEEKRIGEIAAYSFPSNKMQAYTIQKNFREALDPSSHVEYNEVPALSFS